MNFRGPLTSLFTVQLHLVLISEVFSRKTGIVNLQNDAGIVHRTCKDLSPQVLDGIEMMSSVSVLRSLLLQVFLNFSLLSPIISLQASHPLPVGGQAVIQTLQRLLLALDIPSACQTPVHYHSQDPQMHSQLGCWWSGTRRSGSPSTLSLHTCWLSCWLTGLLAG